MRSLLLRTCSLLAGGTLVVACGDPELKTDLDTEGPPEVNMVTVTSEGAPLLVNGGSFAETPTFCRNDGGRVNREICPELENGGRAVDPVGNVVPTNFQVRAVFSELINTDVEELEDRDDDGLLEGHIDNTQPVTIDCGGGAIGYDGHYDPSGNDVSAPPGPSLVAFVTDNGGFPAATGSACTFMISTSVVEDKDGNALPGSEAGPYAFTLANLHPTGSDPEQAFDADGNLAEVEGVAPVDDEGNTTSVAFTFNAPVDVASIDTADIALVLAADDTPVAATVTVAGGNVLITPDAGWLGETSYKLTLTAASTISDASASGGTYDPPGEDFVVLFKTDVLPDAPDAGVDAGVDAS